MVQESSEVFGGYMKEQLHCPHTEEDLCGFFPPLTDNFHLRIVSEYEKMSYVTGNSIKENYWVYVIEAKGSLEPDLLFIFPVSEERRVDRK